MKTSKNGRGTRKTTKTTKKNKPKETVKVNKKPTTDTKPERPVHTPLYNMSGVDRLNAIPDYTKIMDPQVIERTMMKYYVMNKHHLVAASNDPNNTILEMSAISLMKISLDPDHKDYVAVNKYIQARIGGKPREIIEHTGANGGAIAITQEESEAKLDAVLEAMTPKELELYEKTVRMLSGYKAKK